MKSPSSGYLRRAAGYAPVGSYGLKTGHGLPCTLCSRAGFDITSVGKRGVSSFAEFRLDRKPAYCKILTGGASCRPQSLTQDLKPYIRFIRKVLEESTHHTVDGGRLLRSNERKPMILHVSQLPASRKSSCTAASSEPIERRGKLWTTNACHTSGNRSFEEILAVQQIYPRMRLRSYAWSTFYFHFTRESSAGLSGS